MYKYVIESVCSVPFLFEKWNANYLAEQFILHHPVTHYSWDPGVSLSVVECIQLFPLSISLGKSRMYPNGLRYYVLLKRRCRKLGPGPQIVWEPAAEYVAMNWRITVTGSYLRSQCLSVCPVSSNFWPRLTPMRWWRRRMDECLQDEAS